MSGAGNVLVPAETRAAEQKRISSALEATAFMRWVETRQRKPPTNEEVDLWIKGCLDRDGFA